MKNTNGNLPAMPQTHSDNLCQQTGTVKAEHAGLTKREEFAARFMAAWIIHHGSAGGYGYSSQAAALGAIQDADTLLEELERTA